MSSNIQVQRICQYCSNEFTARTTTTLYCSHKCNSAAYKARLRDTKIEESNKQTQRIKTKPIEELKTKPFLSIAETCKLIGISRRTVYRMIERGELIVGKAGKRTILRRSDLDKLFEQPQPVTPQPEIKPEPIHYEISDCYTMGETQNKYGISDHGLNNIIKRFNVPKIIKGKYRYVPKTIIDKILS